MTQMNDSDIEMLRELILSRMYKPDGSLDTDYVRRLMKRISEEMRRRGESSPDETYAELMQACEHTTDKVFMDTLHQKGRMSRRMWKRNWSDFFLVTVLDDKPISGTLLTGKEGQTVEMVLKNVEHFTGIALEVQLGDLVDEGFEEITA